MEATAAGSAKGMPQPHKPASNVIFISYAREDLKVAMAIHDQLKHDGASPWLDVVSLKPGQEWRREIENAIRDCKIFLACLSSGAVSKRGFVQSELKTALTILNEMPEGQVYLMPVRLDPCETPSSLSHLQWIDYFEPGGPAKLMNAIHETIQLRPPRASGADASGPLRFARIAIDPGDPNWREGHGAGDSPFARPCAQRFELAEFVYGADPTFDITIINSSGAPTILTAVGLMVIDVCQIIYMAGHPSAAKIFVSDSYVVEMPSLNPPDTAGARAWGELNEKVRTINEIVAPRIPDPIYLEPSAPYRYRLKLKNYSRNIPNWARIKFATKTDQGDCFSTEIEMFG